jgi:hypothetical protein
VLIEEEKEILEELETTSVFNMREKLKNYIENSVQLHRKGMNLQIQKMQEQLDAVNQKYSLEMKIKQFNLEQMNGEMHTLKFEIKEYQELCETKQIEIDSL